LPIRNLDQYKNFRVKTESDLPPEVLFDWEKAARNKRAVRWEERKTGHFVYVIKTPQYLTSLSKRLLLALECGAAKRIREKGKILYIKDLTKGMEFYGTPNNRTSEIQT